MMRAVILLVVTSALAAVPGMVRADDSVNPFAEGRTTLSLGFGSISTMSSRYFVAGVGVGHFIVSGIEVGIRVERWFSGDPGATMVESNARVVSYQLDFPAKPYFGFLVRRWFVDDQDGLTTVGTRLGLLSVQGRYFLNLGARVEWPTDCLDCEPELAPEVGIAGSF